MLDKTERINNLLDFYSPLLTAKQNDIMDLYYHEDLSLNEIAQMQQTSRSAVFDLVKRCEKILEEYESKLKLLSSYQKRVEIYEKLKKIDNEEVDKLVNDCYKTE